MSDKKLILIVDDEAFNRDIAARLVQRMGHTSVEFGSGEEILDQFTQHKPDLVLLDIHMPRLSGLEVLGKLREIKDKVELPILMITADSDPDSIVKAFDFGANDYVAKPINSKTLRSRIETHLQLADANKQVRDFADDAQKLVEQCTVDLQHRNEELARENKLRIEAEEILRAQKLDVERENKAKSEYFAVLTHELKTPLNIALGFADLISARTTKELSIRQCQEYGTYISDSANQLLNIVDDILTMSSFDIGKLELKETRQNVRAILEGAVGRVKPCPNEKKIEISIECSDEFFLFCDDNKIQRVLVNLLSNAVKFSPAGTRCEVQVEQLEDLSLMIKIMDCGVGIDPDYIDQIMLPYRQTSAGLNREHEGLGLGLPVSRAILGLHNAILEIESEQGRGTTVVVKFPPERSRNHTADEFRKFG